MSTIVLLIAIMKRHASKHFCHGPLTYGLLAKGSASSELLDYLGIGESEKDFVCVLCEESKVDNVFAQLSDHKKFGKGIAFTIPVNGINWLSHTTERNTPMNSTHDLIVSIVNQDYAEEVIQSAKAKGGTLLRARALQCDENNLFDLPEEKEVVVILTDSQSKATIMQSINQQCGLNTLAQGVIFSMPVNDVCKY